MFLKLVILVAVVAIVWFGFKYLERRDRVDDGSRKVGERTFGERLRKSMREKTGSAAPPPDGVEDTEACPVCKAFVTVTGATSCGKPNCPY